MKIDNKWLKRHHLDNFCDVEFSDDKNIVISPNGGGKTRFLKAVMDYYVGERRYPSYRIVFADFPHLTYEHEYRDTDEEDGSAENFEESILLFFVQNARVSLKQYIFLINKKQQKFVDVLFNYGKSLYLRETKFLWKKMTETLNRFLASTIGFEFDSEKSVMIVKGEEKDLQAFQKYIANHASPGERNLFYISIFLASLVAYRKNDQLAIILDEPELHLHIDKIVDFIKTIITEFQNATLWVATHSIHLIPIFDFEESVYLRDGVIQKRGRGFYADVYESIVGTREDLTTFLQDISSWETIRYFEQCLFDEPETATANDEDPQIKGVFSELKEKLENGVTVSVLDYGAGKGRFGEIFDKLLDEHSEYSLDYYTFDLDDEKYTKYIIGKIKCHKEHYTPSKNIHRPLFDYVLLVNVLHEISPDKWIDIFKHIEQVLKNDGFLIFCEALTLNKGEFLGAKHGFLVLEEHSLRWLFGDDIIANYFLYNGERKVILSSIPRNNIVVRKTLYSPNYIASALKILAGESYESYKVLLQSVAENESDKIVRFKNARKLAFYAAQQINALLGMDLLIGSGMEFNINDLYDSNSEDSEDKNHLLDSSEMNTSNPKTDDIHGYEAKIFFKDGYGKESMLVVYELLVEMLSRKLISDVKTNILDGNPYSKFNLLEFIKFNDEITSAIHKNGFLVEFLSSMDYDSIYEYFSQIEFVKKLSLEIFVV